MTAEWNGLRERGGEHILGVLLSWSPGNTGTSRADGERWGNSERIGFPLACSSCGDVFHSCDSRQAGSLHRSFPEQRAEEPKARGTRPAARWKEVFSPPLSGTPRPRFQQNASDHRPEEAAHHALAVDVLHLDPRRFGPACSGGIKPHQKDAVQAVGAESISRTTSSWLRTVERSAAYAAPRRGRAASECACTVIATPRYASRPCWMQASSPAAGIAETSQVLWTQLFRRAAEVLDRLAGGAEITANGRWRVVASLKIVQHALAK
jgi:hypothetical protein